MDREPVLLPLELPLLSDETVTQFVDLLQELVISIEKHYYAQIVRYHQSEQEFIEERRREREFLDQRQQHLFEETDPPF